MRLILRALLVTLLGASGLIGFMWLHRPGLEAHDSHRIPAPPSTQSGALTASWLGVTALLLRDDRHAILIDPFFSRPPGLLNMALNREIAPDEAAIRGWLQRLQIDRLDAVLVSHSHFDHSMDAGVVAKLTGAVLVGSESTANIGRGAEVPESALRVVHDQDGLEFGSFRVRFIASRHAGATGGRPTGDITAPLRPPARYLDYRLGGTWSILIEHPQGRILHHGSAGFIPGALAGQHADVAFLGVALIDDLDRYLHETADAVGARTVIPTHWDDFTRPLDQPLLPFPVVVRLDRFFDDVSRLRPELRVATLALAEPVPIGSLRIE